MNVNKDIDKISGIPFELRIAEKLLTIDEKYRPNGVEHSLALPDTKEMITRECDLYVWWERKLNNGLEIEMQMLTECKYFDTPQHKIDFFKLDPKIHRQPDKGIMKLYAESGLDVNWDAFESMYAQNTLFAQDYPLARVYAEPVKGTGISNENRVGVAVKQLMASVKALRELRKQNEQGSKNKLWIFLPVVVVPDGVLKFAESYNTEPKEINAINYVYSYWNQTSVHHMESATAMITFVAEGHIEEYVKKLMDLLDNFVTKLEQSKMINVREEVNV